MINKTRLNPAANNRRNTVAIIGFFLLVLIVLGGLSMSSKVKTSHIPQTDGVYNLRDFDFENTVQIIDGKTGWESWSQKLYTPEDFTQDIPDKGQPSQSVDYKQINYATHRLTLVLTPGKIYGISMKTAVYSQRLFISGEEIGSVGVPAATKDGFVPGTFERTYFFMPQTERVEIIIQTANWVHGKSGCNPPTVSLGYAENINAMNRRASFFNAFILGCLMLSCLYHLSLFLLNRRRFTTLMFSGCCLLLALMDKKLLYAFFPNINWYIDIRFEYAVNYLTCAILVWFLYKQFPKMLHKFIVYPYCIFALLHLVLLCFDTRILTGFGQYSTYATIIFIVYMIVRFTMSLRSGKLQNILGFVGILVLGLFGINDLIDSRNLITFFSFTGQILTLPVGMVFFVLCYSLLLSVEYAEIKRREEELTAKADFYRRMSHELRTPLTIVSTNIQTARRRPEEARELLTNSQDEIMKMAQMIDDALNDGGDENGVSE